MMQKAQSPGLDIARLATFALWFALMPCGGASAQVAEGADGPPSAAQVRAAYQRAVAGRQEIPRLVRLAFVASNDPDYFDGPSHRSVFTENIASSAFMPTAERTSVRRARRRAISLRMEAALSHEEILAWYMNRVFLGQGCHGVADAAVAYFGRPVNALSVGEAAYIAALPRYPSFLHPAHSNDRAIAERDRVIEEMRVSGFVSTRAAEEAMQMDLGALSPLGECRHRP